MGIVCDSKKLIFLIKPTPTPSKEGNLILQTSKFIIYKTRRVNIYYTLKIIDNIRPWELGDSSQVNVQKEASLSKLRSFRMGSGALCYFYLLSDSYL
jgi:hypothetical protein